MHRRRDIRKLSISSVVRYSPLDLPTGIPVLDAMFEPRHDPFRRLPVRELPRKLRLAMRVAGCATQKEMNARLKAVNPGTGYEASRASQWAQGRSTTRNQAVYDERR